MILTEAAARTRWCPKASTLSHRTSGNRDGLNGDLQPAWPAACACIASRCMMWTWEWAGREREFETKEFLYIPAEDNQPPEGWKFGWGPKDTGRMKNRIWRYVPDDERRGECGLIRQATIERE